MSLKEFSGSQPVAKKERGREREGIRINYGSIRGIFNLCMGTSALINWESLSSVRLPNAQNLGSFEHHPILQHGASSGQLDPYPLHIASTWSERLTTTTEIKAKAY